MRFRFTEWKHILRIGAATTCFSFLHPTAFCEEKQNNVPFTFNNAFQPNPTRSFWTVEKYAGENDKNVDPKTNTQYMLPEETDVSFRLFVFLCRSFCF